MKIFLTVVLVLILLISLTIGLDESAMLLHDEAFQRSMVAFGLAKGLNAVISMIQGTELSIAPVGIGLNFSVGEVLDPFNDMVERFSWVMLVSSISLGVQKLFLLLGSKLFLQVALLFSVATSLTFIWVKKIQQSVFFTLSFKVLILVLLLRFGAIIFVYSSELLYNSLLQTQYQESSIIVQDTKNRLEAIQNKNKLIVESKKDDGFFEQFSSKTNEFVENLNISKQLESLSKNIEEASRKIINLITIFVVQSILMPLLFLWLFVQSVKWIFRFEIDRKYIGLYS